MKRKRAHKRVVKSVARLLLEKKALRVILMDLRKVTMTTDFFIMATGESDTQVRAIVDHLIDETVKRRKTRPWHVEGYELAYWVLVDYVDFVVHVFQPEAREYYNLERLWGDAIIEEVADKTS
ncbi:MAG: ribosome silencing factor [Candidatus Glassbacteria bacterium]